MSGFKREDLFELFSSLGETQLFHLARNESAPVENRLFAVEILVERGYESAKHADLRGLVRTLDIALQMPAAAEDTQLEDNCGAPSASVTTKTLAGEPDSVQKMDEISPTEEDIVSEAGTETVK